MPKIIKKRILKRQLAYAIMAVAKKEIIKSKQHTPFLLPDWVRQLIKYIIIFSIWEYCIPELHMI